MKTNSAHLHTIALKAAAIHGFSKLRLAWCPTSILRLTARPWSRQNPGADVGRAQHKQAKPAVGNTAHLKKLEQAWTSSLEQPNYDANGKENDIQVFKSGYSVDLMSSRELMELRRNIDATLDVRGVEPAST